MIRSFGVDFPKLFKFVHIDLEIYFTEESFNFFVISTRSLVDRSLSVKLFSKVISKLEYYNSTELQQMRKGFAKDNSYVSQIGRIAQKLKELGL